MYTPYTLQCSAKKRGQSGRGGGSGEYGRGPLRPVPVEELREFIREFVHRYSLRHAEYATGIGHETIRKFIEGETKVPYPRSRAAYTRLFWRERGLAHLAEDEVPILWATDLRAIFEGATLEEAKAEVRSIFAAARERGTLPPSAAKLESWILRLLEAEYGDGLPYRKPRRRPGPGGPEGTR